MMHPIDELKIKLWEWAKNRGLGREGGYSLEKLVDEWAEHRGYKIREPFLTEKEGKGWKKTIIN